MRFIYSFRSTSHPKYIVVFLVFALCGRGYAQKAASSTDSLRLIAAKKRGTEINSIKPGRQIRFRLLGESEPVRGRIVDLSDSTVTVQLADATTDVLPLYEITEMKVRRSTMSVIGGVLVVSTGVALLGFSIVLVPIELIAAPQNIGEMFEASIWVIQAGTTMFGKKYNCRTKWTLDVRHPVKKTRKSKKNRETTVVTSKQQEFSPSLN